MQIAQQFAQQVDGGLIAVVAVVLAVVPIWALLLLTCLIIVAMTGSTSGLKDFALVVGAFRWPWRWRRGP